MTFIMDSSISYEKSSNSLHSFLQQHHQHVQQQQQQQLRLNVQHHHHQQQQQHLVDNSEKLHSDHSDQENQHQTDSCLFSRLQSCDQNDSQPLVSCTNPHGIDTILNRNRFGLVSVAGAAGSAGNACTVADTLAAAAACSLQQSAISRSEIPFISNSFFLSVFLKRVTPARNIYIFRNWGFRCLLQEKFLQKLK